MYSHHIQHATNKTKTPAHLQVYPPTKPPLFSSQHLFRHRRGLRVPGDAFQISTLEAHDAMVKFGSMPQYLGCNHPLWGFTRRKQPLDFFIWKHNLGFFRGDGCCWGIFRWNLWLNVFLIKSGTARRWKMKLGRWSFLLLGPGKLPGASC